MIVNGKTYKEKVKLIEKYSQLILLSIFQYARILDVISCRIDRRQFIVLPVNKWLKLTTTALRIIVVFIYYWEVVPSLYNDLKRTPRSFQHMFSLQQILSVAVFSSALLFLRERDELKIITMINRFIKLNNRLSELTSSNKLLCKKFVIFTSLKGCITILGYINELPTLLNGEALNLNKWFITVIGVFMWLGSMFVLDSCYLGFLIIGLMYDNLGSYLQIIMKNLRHIESGDSLSSSLTSYHRIMLVCDYSDKLDIISKMYSRLYATTKEFIAIFQWHILYYIYYNFMVIFLLLNHFIWQYMHSGYIDIIEILMVMVKIGNLSLIIVCANYVVEKSETPNRLNIDIICSDVDVRWDATVETFLSERKVENLEIKILGLFTINNQFILLILSATISYLFLIIQFGFYFGPIFSMNFALRNRDETAKEELAYYLWPPDDLLHLLTFDDDPLANTRAKNASLLCSMCTSLQTTQFSM